jgi:hypothetical protein
VDDKVIQLIFFLAGAGLVGLVGLLVNGLKTEIRDMKKILMMVVTEPLCKERRENIEKDINNLGKIMRGE